MGLNNFYASTSLGHRFREYTKLLFTGYRNLDIWATLYQTGALHLCCPWNQASDQILMCPLNNSVTRESNPWTFGKLANSENFRPVLACTICAG